MIKFSTTFKNILTVDKKWKYICQQPNGDIFLCTNLPTQDINGWRDKGVFILTPFVGKLNEDWRCALFHLLDNGEIIPANSNITQDTKILVSPGHPDVWLPMHLDHLEADGTAWVYADGRTSWTREGAPLLAYPTWKLP